MEFPRESGILLHPTSLPGPHGVGDFGNSAFRFVDWLERAGQRLWQVMPLGPTGFGDSPYSSPSAFAGNPLLVSLEWLHGDGLLVDEDIHPVHPFPEHVVDFDSVTPFRMNALRRAFDRLESGTSPGLKSEFDEFVNSPPVWLHDYALFVSIKKDLGGGWWLDWPKDIRTRQPAAITEWSEKLATDIRFHSFVQFLFLRQWGEVRKYANDRGIRVIGDIPIFVALDSADVWANQDQFQLDSEGRPRFVAGVPPDFFSKTGQLWGNPTYDWSRMKEDGYAWWVERLRATRTVVDIVRIDHFRGFGAAWHVPAGDPDATGGHWEVAPGGEVFAAAMRELGEFPVIVEDLGIITPDIVTLREILNFPGMNVLHFAFDDDPANMYLPHNVKRNSVTYTATHDNQTSVGWFGSLSDAERQSVRHYLGHHADDIAWDLLRLAWASVSNTAIAPMQDVLRLGDEARMNTPATASGNWAWRMLPSQLDPLLADGMRDITRTYGRTADVAPSSGKNPWDYTDPHSGISATRSW